jgi:TPR repeat protein
LSAQPALEAHARGLSAANKKGSQSVKRFILTIVLLICVFAPPLQAQQASSSSEALAFEKTLKSAKAGDAEAQFALGGMYRTGKGIPKNQAAATEWYRKAAEQGHARAQLEFGKALELGRGIPRDLTEAAKWIRKASEALAKASEALALEKTLKSAEAGDAEAQFELGGMFRTGKGITEDQVAATEWYRKAAEQGHARAQLEFGKALEFGRGIPRDLTEAAKWIRKAAEQDNSDAFFSLGKLYYFGWGVPRDTTEAARWFRKLGNNSYVFRDLGYVFYEQGGLQNRTEAARWFRLSHEAVLSIGWTPWRVLRTCCPPST